MDDDHISDDLDGEGENDLADEPVIKADKLPSDFDKAANKWISVFGMGVRCSFFLVATLGVFVWISNIDSSAFSTPFAQLTISRLLSPIASIVGGCWALWLLWKWAFRSGKKDYNLWAKAFGFVAGVCNFCICMDFFAPQDMNPA